MYLILNMECNIFFMYLGTSIFNIILYITTYFKIFQYVQVLYNTFVNYNFYFTI